MITDWFTDDDISDKEEDNFGECDVYQPPANFRQSSRLLSSSKSTDKSDNPNAFTSLSGISTILGKDKTVWKNSSNSTVQKTSANNIFNGPRGVPRQVSQSITSAYNLWKQFLPELILCSIVKYTTEEAHRKSDTNFSLGLYELEAFIALQYARSLYGKKHPISFLYNKEYAISIFPETMLRDRFIKILKYLRFDDKFNRKTRSDMDQFAPIRDVFVKFASMCQKKYKYNFSLIVNEQLMPVKSCCPFITFMPNKPEKYGIKFWVLVDDKTKYVANILFFLELKNEKKKEELHWRNLY